MYRKAIVELEKWKSSSNRKPLILRGARQVGKTWLLQEFGRKNYKTVAYVNLENDERVRSLFDLNFDTKRIIDGIELATNTKISPEDTLIILDEIQEVPRAITSLKYFNEDAPEYHIAVAGSLLGITLHEQSSFPVGKVDFLDIHPLNFYEFLIAIGKDKLAEAILQQDFELLAPFHDQIIDYLKTYFVTGGMPAAVQNYLDEDNLLEVRRVQGDIITSYEQDFSKHAPKNVALKIQEIFNILGQQLAKENKKFIFKMLREGARAKDYEMALLWLEDAGIVRRVNRVNSLKLPLSVYANKDIFKLYMVDLGLLGAKVGLAPQTILDKNSLFVEFKGALTEQFVFQELYSVDVNPFYYAKEDSRGEIDFMIDTNGVLAPIEVKSDRNTASVSFKNLMDSATDIKHGVKLTLLPYVDNGRILNIPLYAAATIKSLGDVAD